MNKTKNRIIDAAETLFAEQGFEQTTMRAITSIAGVNLASVNYHFGTKKSLMQAVLQRYLDVFAPQVESRLLTLQSEEGNVEVVLMQLVEPLLAMDVVRPNGTSIFLRLLGRGYMESQGHLRKFIEARYGATLERFVTHTQSALPGISREDVFWRLHFAMGSFVFSVNAAGALSEIAQADYNQSTDTQDMLLQLVSFVAAGLSYTSPGPHNTLRSVV